VLFRSSPKLRSEVLSRDGRVCATPGCTNKGTIFAHHVVWKSLGGATSAENEVWLKAGFKEQ